MAVKDVNRQPRAHARGGFRSRSRGSLREPSPIRAQPEGRARIRGRRAPKARGWGHLNKTYDNFLRVSSWNVDGAGAVSLTYDGDSFVTAAGGMAVTRGNTGLLKSTTLGAVTDAFSYSAYGEVTGHTVTGSATSYVATYTRDAAGRIDTKTETVGGVSHSERYTYDAAGRLWQVFVDGASTPYREWMYDANGNRADGTYDAQDRQLTHEGFSYAYGPNGELAKKTDDVTLAETFYSYDAQGNLRSVTRPSPLAGIEYVIDGQNRRIGKKVGGALVQGFLYDGARIVAELDGNGAVVSRFVYATGEHSPDLMFKGGATYRFVKDHLGSPRLLVDAATGAVAQRMDFDEWGVVTNDTSPGFQPFGFAGGLWDVDTGMVRFGARDYDPAAGRWTSKDANHFAGGLNLYAYTENNPANQIDPSGSVPIPSGPQGCIAAAIAFYWSCVFSTGDHEGCLQKAVALIELCYRKIPPKDPMPQCKN
jgi:RHS repeat-associated protein